MSEPKLVNLPAFEVAGLPVRTTNAEESGQGTTKIGAHWQRFFAEGHHERIPKTADKLLGVYTDYESNNMGAFSLITGFEVLSVEDLPDGIVGVQIPEQDYLVFHAEGEMPTIVIETWGRVMAYFEANKEYEHAYTADFELYPNENEVDIHIAVRAKN
ncbi:MAG: effector binding domain-containing protein [Bacteroidetes bacterium]|nr:effector binding domain-containing protein [Bacteroidota bacterium]